MSSTHSGPNLPTLCHTWKEFEANSESWHHSLTIQSFPNWYYWYWYYHLNYSLLNQLLINGDIFWKAHVGPVNMDHKILEMLLQAFYNLPISSKFPHKWLNTNIPGLYYPGAGYVTWIWVTWSNLEVAICCIHSNIFVEEMRKGEKRESINLKLNCFKLYL